MKNFTSLKSFKILPVFIILLWTSTVAAQTINVDKTTINVVGCHNGSFLPNYRLNVSGSGLSGAITITPPPNCSLSADGSIWNNSPRNLNGSFNYYVRIDNSAPLGTYSDDIVLSSNGATTVKVRLTGTVYETPNFTVNSIPAINSSSTSFTAFFNNSTSSVGVQYNFYNNNLPLHVSGNISANPIVVPTNPLQPGSYPITYYFQQNGCQSYPFNLNLQVTQGPTNAHLLSLDCNPALSSFDPNVFNYSVNIPYPQNSIDITPSVADATSTISINGSSANSGIKATVSNLKVGDNIIPIKVTAYDGFSAFYNITVKRAFNPDNYLTSISFSNGLTLNQNFSQTTYSYTASANNSNTQTIITAVPHDANATYTVNGKSPSIPVDLAVGNNTINIDVTAQDGTTRRYIVIIARAASTNYRLSNLQLSTGGVSRFSPTINLYQETVSNSVSSVTVTPTLADSTATVTVNGNPVADKTQSLPIALPVGRTSIYVVVTAQDTRYALQYKVDVTRLPSSNADLAQLDVQFEGKTFGYGPVANENSLSVVNTTSSVVLTPGASDPNAIVKVNGTVVATGSSTNPIPLSVGLNSISVGVTAQDGTTLKTYKVYITRTPDNSLTLSGYKGTVVTINAPGTSGVPAGSTAVDFTGTTAVMIGGVPAASFAVLGPDRIDAIIGDSPSGDIVVTTPTGTVTPAKFVLLSSLPVNFVYLKSKVVTDGVSLEWMVADAWDTKEFIVERSSDGINFSPIGKVSANKTVSTYAYTDLNAGGNTGYYRVKSVSLSSGHSIYSTIVKNNVEGNKSTFSVYPNPVTGKVLTVSVSNLKAGLYNLILTTSTGVEILHKQLTVSTGTTTYNISLPAAVPNGVYTISLKGNDVFNTQQIIVNNK